ncbi:MAG: HAD hydrolase family protein [Candidatus Woesearchaeota archaeon]
MHIDENLQQKLKDIELLIMDVDGTMTDSCVYYSAKGEEFKKFSIRDGMGIELLKLGNIKTAIVTTEDTPIVLARAKKLRIEEVITGSRNKGNAILELSKKLSIQLEKIAYIGDDVNDLPAIRIVGFSACPQNAVDIIKENVDYICINKGGDGAIREISELILKSQNKLTTLPENW